jgi:hypothetical protein
MGETDKKPVDGGSHKKKWHGHKKKRCPSSPSKPTTIRPEKFEGGKEELAGNYFHCTCYGQSDGFLKTVEKIADYVGQEHKSGGVTRTEVITQQVMVIPMPSRPVPTTTTAADGAVTTSSPDALDISDCQREKKIVDYQIQNHIENRQKLSLSHGSNARNQCMQRLRHIATARPLNRP